MAFRVSKQRALLLAALMACSAPARAAETWLRLETPHFELAGNVGEGQLKRVALKFESFRNVLEQILRLDPDPSVGRLPRVFVFKDRGSYRPYLPIVDSKPVEVGGYFLPGHARPYITLTLTPWAKDPYQVVFHEYVHLVNSKAHGPSWFSEGYAEFLANCVIDGDRVSVGRPDTSHIWTLRTRTPFPLLTLMSMPVPAHDQQAQRLFYAQSWLLVHYLMTERTQGREQMLRFLNTAGSGQATEESFVQAFGSSSGEMAKELQRHVEGLTMAFFNVRIAKSALPRDLKPRRIPAAEAEALLADLVAQHRGREAEGRERLERVLQQEPALSVARDALTDLERPPQLFLPGHDVTEAAELVVASDPLSGLATRLSQIMVSDGPPDPAEAADLEADLRAYIERSPSNPEGFITLAQLRRRMGARPAETIGLLEQAVAAEPSAISPRLALSHAHGSHGDVDASRRVLEEGAALVVDPALQSIYARELEMLAPLHRAVGFLVNLECDPSGRLDFVIEKEGGQRLKLRAADPTSFLVFREGESVKESLNCGPQRRPMAVTYADLKAPPAGIDGELRSLDLTDR